MKHYWEPEELVETFTLLHDEHSLLSGDEQHNQLGLAVLLKLFQAEVRLGRATRLLAPLIFAL